jgi:hypothetical protein
VDEDTPINQRSFESMTIEPTWLDIEPSTTVAVADSRELVEALEQLTPQQAQFLEVLVACRYDAVEARDIFRDQHNKVISTNTLMKWMREEDFVAAVKLRESLAAQVHGVSVASVFANLSDICRRNQGRGTAGDRLALSSLELQAKILGMTKPDTEQRDTDRVGPNLTIQLMNRDGSVVTVSAGGENVNPNLPPPERLVNP